MEEQAKKEKDFRISYLIQNCKEEPFFIQDIVDGFIIFKGQQGTDLKLRCKLPRKILSETEDSRIYVTKGKFLVKTLKSNSKKSESQDLDLSQGENGGRSENTGESGEN